MLLPESEQRLALLEHTGQLIDTYFEQLEDFPVSPDTTSTQVREFLDTISLEQSDDLRQLTDTVYTKLRDWGMKVAHPGYYGLFNPAPSFAGILADLLVAGLNPQIGAWHHNPFGVEVERRLIRYFAGRFGLPESAYGNFTSGGSEANTTGVIVALTQQFPEFSRSGVRGISGQPVFYVSDEFHHSFEKIAHTCGLGRDAVRKIPTDDQFRLSTAHLEAAIQRDRDSGCRPFMVVATAGTTNAGVIDPLPEIARVCERENLHMHVDAAWGGAAILSDHLKGQLAGIEYADTITFDPHKWLSVPMAAGMLICREARWLADAFHVDTAYVPESSEIGMDNYRLSLQFSRRFIGLKLFMTLAHVGREGYAETLEHQVAMARYLVKKLPVEQWRVVNSPDMAIVCFEYSGIEEAKLRAAKHAAVVKHVIDSGRAWISETVIAGRPVIRVCVTSYLTQTHHVDELVNLLTEAS